MASFNVMKVKVISLSHVRLFATPWTVAYQDPPAMWFSRQEYWSGLPFPSLGDPADPGIEPGFLHYRQMLYRLSHLNYFLKDRRQEEKGTTEDKMVGWHHRLNRHEFDNLQMWRTGKPGMLKTTGVAKSWTWLNDIFLKMLSPNTAPQGLGFNIWIRWWWVVGIYIQFLTPSPAFSSREGICSSQL